jgi:cytoskeletal protein CcmA (bactofilin family)
MRKFRRVMFLKFARMFRGEKNIVPCIISTGTKITGNVTDGDVIHVDGILEGDIVCNELVLGATGSIVGNVRAHTIEIYGELTGSIKAESLFIASTAKFVGDSTYKTIAIEPGARLEGKCSSLNG